MTTTTRPTIAIVTNIDPEHMEHWGTFDNLRKGFFDFVSNVPFYGLAVCCTDHPEVQALVGAERERIAAMIEGTVYTSHGDGRSLEPVSASLVGMDMHHATIAAAIRALSAVKREAGV